MEYGRADSSLDRQRHAEAAGVSGEFRQRAGVAGGGAGLVLGDEPKGKVAYPGTFPSQARGLRLWWKQDTTTSSCSSAE